MSMNPDDIEADISYLREQVRELRDWLMELDAKAALAEIKRLNEVSPPLDNTILLLEWRSEKAVIDAVRRARYEFEVLPSQPWEFEGKNQLHVYFNRP
jgi:hypothetical protein